MTVRLLNSVLRSINPVTTKWAKFAVQRSTTDINHQLRLILDCLKIDTVIDVGAHRGEFYNQLRRYGFKGIVKSIEPSSRAYSKLKVLESKDPLLEVFQFAVFSHESQLEIHEYESTLLNSIYRPHKDDPFLMGKIKTSETIETITLDSFLARYTPNATNVCLKIDTQGSESDVLKGLTEKKASIALMQIETSIHEMYEGASNIFETLQWLKSNNFEVLSITTEGFIRDKLRAFDVDLLCLNREFSLQMPK